MGSLRLWLGMGALALLTPLTAAADAPTAGTAVGTVAQCPGYPIPPFTTLTHEGVKLTIANSCRVDSGTVSGVVRGIQYNVTLPDSSRMSAGLERLEGSVAGRRGIADFRWESTRPCFPSCATRIHVYAIRGMEGLEGLRLDLIATGTGTGPFTYIGTYSFAGDRDNAVAGGGADPLTVIAAEPNSGNDGDNQSANTGTASGTVTLCSGYPVPPFTQLAQEGIKLTIGTVCHIYGGTVSGRVEGTQYTVIFPDTSRMAAGSEVLEGSVAGRPGTAGFMFTAARQCFPACPSTVHIWATEGTQGLHGLQLDITAVGLGILTYSGSYAFGDGQERDSHTTKVVDG